MKQEPHSHGEVRQSDNVLGYKPNQQVTRYEAAVALFSLVSALEKAQAQPRRISREVQPGRRGAAPKPSSGRFSDVPMGHWASKSLVGLATRGIALQAGTAFEGETSLTGNDLGRWADSLAGWLEGRPSTARTLQDLVRGGYLPQTAAVLKKSSSPVSASETTTLLVSVVTRAMERISTASADSRFNR